MRNKIVKIVAVVLVLLLVLAGMALLIARKNVPTQIQYGISFNTLYAEELGLDTREVFDAFVEDLGARRFRLAAHWSMVAEDQDRYDFSELDYQLEKVKSVEGEVIFGVGRRLPRWPECHVPDWAGSLTWEEQKKEIKKYIEAVITRYKNETSIVFWQIENEPFLEVFAHDFCGDLDESFLDEEIALVRELDPTRPILITDSGNLGTWVGAYKRGDVFGTSMYVYFWNPELGQFKTVLPPWFYRFKEGVISLIYGDKPTLLIELSLEPWLLEPVTDVPIDVQYSRMDLEKFNEIIEYAEFSRYKDQYLWGGEWWYWLKEQGRPEMWERGRKLFIE